MTTSPIVRGPGAEMPEKDPKDPMDWSRWMRALGRQGRRAREFLGLSQEQLAAVAGVSQGAVSRLEAGRGLATPMLVVLKINLALTHALRRVDPTLLNDELKRVLRSGTFPDGHVVPGTAMPWPVFSNWSEEDRHAVVVYLRHLKPIVHKIPDPDAGNAVTIPGAIEQDYGAKDYGVSQKRQR